VLQQVPLASTYNYADNPWRGEYVSPMAANMQWDVVRSADGRLLVKMLYNEKETDFKAACDGARYAAGSHYYDYQGLKACYGHTTP
jgi:phage-related tail fiber protein